ncbi:hypothetical protein [Guyparkeria sp.]|uniref:hypothetical protein n=1 Tax=Guyparkeria sp. TaxID=2035736 RepID=UPI0035692AD2
MSNWNQKLRKSMLAAGVCMAVGFGGNALAQQGGQQQAPHGGAQGGAQGQMPELSPEQQQLMEEMRAVQQELQQTQQQLSEMEQQAYESNPELGQQREALQDKIAEKMSGGGYDAEKEFEEMKATMSKYQDGEQQPSESEVQAFQEKQQKFQQRQQQAFQDEEVQQMAEKLRSDVESVMKKSNPEAEQLFNQMDEKAAEMEQLREKAMQMQQGG